MTWLHSTTTRDVEAIQIPSGNKTTIPEGTPGVVTQTLGGSYTVIVNGNMFRIEGKDADALGLEVAAPKTTSSSAGVKTPDALEKEIWEQLKTCYDPEIPVNIVDLGLIYDCHLTSVGENSYKADVKMTLTAPGCGMGPTLAQDVQNKLISLEPIDEANVELVWDPPWNQGMMTEAAKLLREAADLSDDAAFAKYLRLRADALLTEHQATQLAAQDAD